MSDKKIAEPSKHPSICSDDNIFTFGKQNHDTEFSGCRLASVLDLHNLLVHAGTVLDNAFYDSIIAVGDIPADAVKLFKQFTVLGRIGPQTAHEMSAELKLDATEAIKKLESRGLVDSVKDGEGNVAWQLTLTSLIIGNDERYYDSIDRQLATIFTDDEMTMFADRLGKIRESFAKDP